MELGVEYNANPWVYVEHEYMNIYEYIWIYK